jgi:thioredoxin-related protein
MKRSLLGCVAAALFCLTLPAFSQDTWTSNYDKAVARAQAENKAILLDFTGSDWCPWCMKLKQEVFDSGQFKDYARDHLVLVEVDFPANDYRSQQVREQNNQLSKKYNIQGYPTVVILSKDQGRLGTLGYMPGGPSVFLDHLRRIYRGGPGKSESDGGSDDFDSFFNKPAATPAPSPVGVQLPSQGGGVVGDQSQQAALALLTNGKWQFHGVKRVFHPDGTITSDNPTTGVWQVANGELVVVFKKLTTRFPLPIKPKGTVGTMNDGKTTILHRVS